MPCVTLARLLGGMVSMRKRTAAVFVIAFIALFSTLGSLRAQSPGKPVRIAVDLREAPKRIFHARMEFAVTQGPLTLVYPKWIPGEHGPNGPIVDVAGMHFRVGGKDIAWLRDDVDLFAFHCEIP